MNGNGNGNDDELSRTAALRRGQIHRAGGDRQVGQALRGRPRVGSIGRAWLQRGLTPPNPDRLGREANAQSRDEIAEQRDRVSAARDLKAEARDELAAVSDKRLERQRDPNVVERITGGQRMLRGDRQRRGEARSRRDAAAERVAAAKDREHAARDRRQAALDRHALARELAASEVDEVTGALGRRTGLAAIQREMDRSRRTGEQLVLAYVDVDGLKRVNDDSGHAAGDDLLRDVVRCMAEEFRSYDLVARFGGDEFVCSLSGDGLTDVSDRFGRIGARLAKASSGGTISIGLSQALPDDTIEMLIHRADSAMIGSRRNR
ncbi:MAG: hypothetical protein NVSMB25_22760 [Thermoleophilaceae bacterium]